MQYLQYKCRENENKEIETLGGGGDGGGNKPL